MNGLIRTVGIMQNVCLRKAEEAAYGYWETHSAPICEPYKSKLFENLWISQIGVKFSDPVGCQMPRWFKINQNSGAQFDKKMYFL